MGIFFVLVISGLLQCHGIKDMNDTNGSQGAQQASSTVFSSTSLAKINFFVCLFSFFPVSTGVPYPACTLPPPPCNFPPNVVMVPPPRGGGGVQLLDMLSGQFRYGLRIGRRGRLCSSVSSPFEEHSTTNCFQIKATFPPWGWGGLQGEGGNYKGGGGGGEVHGSSTEQFD